MKQLYWGYVKDIYVLFCSDVSLLTLTSPVSWDYYVPQEVITDSHCSFSWEMSGKFTTFANK